MSLRERIWKYRFHYVVVIPALAAIIILKGIPLFAAFQLAFTDFQVEKGLMGGEWVGWKHFNELWGSFAFTRVLLNTLRLKLVFILLSGVIALILALAVSGIKAQRIRGMFQTIFLLPYFIPTVVMAYIAMLFVSPSQSPLFRDIHVLLQPGPWVTTVQLVQLVSAIGIPVMIALAAIHARETRSFSTRLYLAFRAVLAFMLLQLSTLLTVDFELFHTLYNPMVYGVADTLDTYRFRTGVQDATYSITAAVWVTQFAVQLVLTILVYLLVRRWFLQDLFHPEAEYNKPHPSRERRGAAGSWAVAVLFSIIALVPLLMLVGYPFLGSGESLLATGNLIQPGSYVTHILLAVFIALVYMLMTVTLAYPLTVKDLPGRTLYKMFLLLILVASTGGIHEYVYFRGLGVVNTWFAPMFSGIVSVIGVFVLKSIFNRKYADMKEQASRQGAGEMRTFFILFLPKMWKPLIALGVLQFVTIWNSYQPALMYLQNRELFPPTLALRNLVMAGPTSGVTPHMVLVIGLAVSLPSIILFLIFRRWLTSELFLNEVRKF